MLKRFSFIIICLTVTVLASAQLTKRAAVYYDAGMKAAAKGLYPDAILSFQMAVSLNKMYDSAYAEMGNAYYRINKIDSALICYKKALTVNPNWGQMHLAIGNIYRDVKMQYDEAIIHYKDAIKVNPSDKLACYSLAWCYNAKKDYDNAILYATKALDIDNNYRHPYNELAHAYRQTAKYEDCVAQFKKNMAISPIDLPVYYCGLCLLQLNQKEEAMKMQEQLLKINPKLAETLRKKVEAGPTPKPNN